MSQPITLMAQRRAAASALAGILLVLGAAGMPFWRCCRPHPAGGAELAADP